MFPCILAKEILSISIICVLHEWVHVIYLTVFCPVSSFVGNEAAAKLEPFAALAQEDSLVNRDLEKVNNI